MEHRLPALPFAADALAPVISRETLEHHHGKHHRAYVTNLNKLLTGTEFESMSLEEIGSGLGREVASRGRIVLEE